MRITFLKKAAVKIYQLTSRKATVIFCGGTASAFNIFRPVLSSAALLSFFLVFSSSASHAARPEKPFDHTSWQQFLDRFVNEEGEVRFAEIKQDPVLLNDYLAYISRVEPVEFYGEWPREEQLALFLNLFHAAMIKLIIEHYPVSSTQDIAGFWDLPAATMGLKSFSLNELRKEELIERYEDEKIHTALSCAAESCPPFPRQAFTGPRVEGQLFLAAKNFVNNPKFVQINPGGKKVFLSRIFKWYQKDFTLDFGQFDEEDKGKLTKQEKAVLSFVAYYLDDAQKLRYLEERNYRLDYLPFNWDLNDAGAAVPAQN